MENGMKFLGRALSAIKQVRGIAVKETVGPALKETGLHHITYVPKNPFELFKNWHGEQTANHLAANALCLSTSTKSGIVSSRTLILRRLDEDGFVIMTDNRSKKSDQLAENPRAAMNFLWVNNNDDGLVISRQVRVEGEVKQLEESQWLEIYENEPLFCKIRSIVCHQGQIVDWDKLKDHHDQVFSDWERGEIKFEKPSHVVAYKMFPNMMEFYETIGQQIADRIMFLKRGNDWESKRLAA